MKLSSPELDCQKSMVEEGFKGILYIKELMEGEGIGKEEKDEITRQFVECGKKLEEFT